MKYRHDPSRFVTATASDPAPVGLSHFHWHTRKLAADRFGVWTDPLVDTPPPMGLALAASSWALSGEQRMSNITEADDASVDMPLVALANIRYQIAAGESPATIDMYARAAVATGLSISEVNQYIALSQICWNDETYLQPLCAATQAYLAGMEGDDGYAAFIGAASISATKFH